MSDRTPKTPGTASIFANALATTRSWLKEDPGAHLHALTCRSCGAPRHEDREDMRCDYCGGQVLGPRDPSGSIP